MHEQRPDLLGLRDERLVMRAHKNFRSVGEPRRRIIGTDAPQRMEADITNNDGILSELNASLAAVGMVPVEAVA